MRPARAVRTRRSGRWCCSCETGRRCRFGRTQEALQLMREWLQATCTAAGGAVQASSISHGCVGVAETRIEVDLDFASAAAFHSALSALPAEQQAVWLQRAQVYPSLGRPCLLWRQLFQATERKTRELLTLVVQVLAIRMQESDAALVPLSKEERGKCQSACFRVCRRCCKWKQHHRDGCCTPLSTQRRPARRWPLHQPRRLHRGSPRR